MMYNKTKVKKYVKKPIEIEAIQIRKDSVDDIYDFTDENCVLTGGGLVIQTLEGDMLGKWGDYVIKGVRGEFYPCSEEIFNETYDLVGK